MSKNEDDVVCCGRCGRDTQSKSGVCGICSGRVFGTAKFGNMRGMKCRNNASLAQDEEPEEETSTSRYHGDNIRDDT